MMDKINQQAFDVGTVLVLEIFRKPNTRELLEMKESWLTYWQFLKISSMGIKKKKLFKYSKTIQIQIFNLYM